MKRSNKPFGECSCGKWGFAPTTFDERIHFLKCECGKLMYLINIGTPEDVALRDRNKIEPTTVNQ